MIGGNPQYYPLLDASKRMVRANGMRFMARITFRNWVGFFLWGGNDVLNILSLHILCFVAGSCRCGWYEPVNLRMNNGMLLNWRESFKMNRVVVALEVNYLDFNTVIVEKIIWR